MMDATTASHVPAEDGARMVTAGPLSPGIRPTGRRLAAFVVASAVLLALLSCWRYWSVQGLRSYLPDEGIYTFVGWSWLHGDWPYRGAWDHKGPVIFLITLIRTALLGSSPEMTGVQEIAMGLATAAILGAAAWLLWGVLAAAMVGLAGVLLWTQLGPTGGHMSTAGSIIALLNALCILFTVCAIRSRGRRRTWLLFVLGVAGGLGFLAKPNAIGAIAAGWLVLVWIGLRPGEGEPGKPRGIGGVLRDTGIIVAGAVAPMLIVGLIFGLAGDLRQLIEVAYIYNAKIRGPGILGENSLFGLAKKMARGLNRLHVLFPVGVAMLVTILALGERVRGRADGPLFASAEAIAPLWLAMSLAVYASNGVYGHHIYPVLFAVALAMGWMISITLRLLGPGREMWGLAIAVPMLIWPCGELARLHRSPNQAPPDWRIVGERIKAETRPDQRILVFARMWGPSVLAVSERRTAVRYIHSPPLYNRGYTSDARWGEVTAVLEATEAPPFVVIPWWNLPDPPGGVRTVDWLVGAIDHAQAAGPLTDPTPYPNRELTKRLLVERYDLDYCEGLLCVLELARPPGAAAPTP
jgi:hypothetical protein